MYIYLTIRNNLNSKEMKTLTQVTQLKAFTYIGRTNYVDREFLVNVTLKDGKIRIDGDEMGQYVFRFQNIKEDTRGNFAYLYGNKIYLEI